MTASTSAELQSPGGAEVLRRAFGCFPSGVTAVCGMAADGPVGMAASSFTSVSIDPPLLGLCVRNGSKTWEQLRSCPAVGVSVLASDHVTACRALAGPADHRFTDLLWLSAPSGAPLVQGAVAWFDCSLFAEHPAGDHTIALLHIEALDLALGARPLVFHRSAFATLS